MLQDCEENSKLSKPTRRINKSANTVLFLHNLEFMGTVILFQVRYLVLVGRKVIIPIAIITSHFTFYIGFNEKAIIRITLIIRRPFLL